MYSCRRLALFRRGLLSLRQASARSPPSQNGFLITMTQLVPGPETSPRFSIITAVYNVSTYLPAFIASVDAQAFPAGQLEVVAVDDGSTDESLALLRDWERRRPGVVRVLTKENGGQSTARNLGLEVARIVHGHPTLSEAVMEAARAADGWLVHG